MINLLHKKAFINTIHAAATHHHPVSVFQDFVRAFAISIESPLIVANKPLHDQLESEYSQIQAKYSITEFQNFPAAFSILITALQENREDFLGNILESLNAANTHNGQFLTPPSVGRLMASIASRGLTPNFRTFTPPLIISDPSAGSSTLLIEAAELLNFKQSDFLLVAADLDSTAANASFVQLSLLGYPAIVLHIDSLSNKHISHPRFSPGYFLHSFPMRFPNLPRSVIPQPFSSPVSPSFSPSPSSTTRHSPNRKSPPPTIFNLRQSTFNF